MLRSTFPSGLTRYRWFAAALVFGISVAVAQEQLVDRTMQTQTEADKSAAEVQIRISQIADETTNLIGDYRVTTQQLDRTQIYNQNLDRLITSQEEEKQRIQEDLENFVETRQDIVPLMQSMIDTLARFIELDMPFQMQERTARVDRLRESMDRADITIAEKYRQIMDAYQIEANFGRDSEAYTGPLQIEGGPERQVDFLRVGRILLAYQTADGAETGYWNKVTGEWQELPDEYRRSIGDGLRVARRQTAPQLLKLPVPAAEAAR
ncbi:DUF3450 domain-containing protein [soil metagenome]